MALVRTAKSDTPTKPRTEGIRGRAYSFFLSCGAKSIPKKLLTEIFFYIYRNVEFPLQSASGFPYKSEQISHDSLANDIDATKYCGAKCN